MKYFNHIISILCTIAIVCNGKISDLRQCADLKCATPVSYAKTLLKYNSDDPRILAFQSGEKVTVYSKSAGTRPDLWGVEIKGKRGYAPVGMLREDRVLISKLEFVVSTESEAAPHIASSVAPLQVSVEHPTNAYEVVDGTTLFFDNVETTAYPHQPAIQLNLPKEKLEERQEKMEIPVEQEEVSQDKAEVPQEKVGVPQENVELHIEKVDDNHVNVEHQDKVNHQEKVDDMDKEEEPQEEGSAQRIFQYITSLLPSEGSGFLSSTEEQDAEKPVDEAPGSGESMENITSEEQPYDSSETTLDETSSEELSSEERFTPSAQLEVDQVSINSDTMVEKILDKDILKDGEQIVEVKQTEEVNVNSESGTDTASEPTPMPEIYPPHASSLPDAGLEGTKDVNQESDTDTASEPTPMPQIYPPHSSSLPDAGLEGTKDVNPESVTDTSTPVHEAYPPPVLPLSDAVLEVADNASEPIPMPEIYPPPASSLPEAVLEVYPVPLSSRPNSVPASSIPDSVPVSSDNDLPLPDHILGSDSRPEPESNSSPDPGSDPVTDTIPDTFSLHSSNSITYQNTAHISDTTSDFVPTPDPIPNIDPNPSVLIEAENKIEKTEESHSSQDSLEDLELDRLSVGSGGHTNDQLPLDPAEDVVGNYTLQSNNTVPEMPSDHVHETTVIENKDDTFQLPWNPPEEITTEKPAHDHAEHADFVSTTESSGVMEEVETESGPGFLTSIMNMFAGSSDRSGQTEEEVVESKIFEDEAMQGDQPQPDTDLSEEQTDDGDQKPWWSWSLPDIGKGSAGDDSIFIEPPGSYYGILTIAITAMAVLVFTLGYYRIENSRQDSTYVGKINKLEKALYVSTTECLQLREELDATSSQTTSRVLNNEEISRLREEIEEKSLCIQDLEERVHILTAEVEAATETGEELNRMLGDYLADNQATSQLRDSVDHLQEQLINQQTTISATNTLLFNKKMENDLFRNEIATLKDKLDKTYSELHKSNEMCDNLRDESMKQKEEWTRNHEQEISSQQLEVTRLEKSVSELKETLETRRSEIKILEEMIEKVNHGDSLQEMLDLAGLTAKLENFIRKNEVLNEQLTEEIGSRKLLEDHVRVITHEIIALGNSNTQAEKEKTEAINKLTILTTYFEEKEAQLQKDIDTHEAMFKQKSGDAESMYSHMKMLQEQSNHSKSQIEMLKKECHDQEKSLKEQIFAADTRAHENWVAARQAERKCEEMKQEAAILRNRLTTAETQLAKNALMAEHPPIVNDRVPNEGNGDMHLSPHHMHYMDLSYSPRPYMPPPLYEADQRLPPLGCLPTAPLPPPPVYSRARHYEPGFRPLPPHNRSRQTGSNSSGHSSGSIEKPGHRKQFDS